MGQHGGMHHIWVSQDDVRLLADGLAVSEWSVAIIRAAQVGEFVRACRAGGG